MTDLDGLLQDKAGQNFRKERSSISRLDVVERDPDLWLKSPAIIRTPHESKAGLIRFRAWVQVIQFLISSPLLSVLEFKHGVRVATVLGTKKGGFIVFGLLWITSQMFQRGYSVTWTGILNFLCPVRRMERRLGGNFIT